MLTVKVQPPRSTDVLRKNPLGLYVDAIDWSRELETPVPSPAEGPADRQPAAPAPLPAPSENLPLGSPLDPTRAQPEPQQTPERNAQ
jgi:type IV secretion system protein VirB5